MICHSIEYLLWWTDERDEGIEQVTQQKTGSMPASPATYTYKYIHMFVFQMEPKGEEKLTLAALKFLRVLHAVDNGKYSPHLGCQAETQTRI